MRVILMRIVIVLGIVAGLAGCQSARETPPPYMQNGKTVMQMRADYAQCEKTAMQASR